VSALTHVQSRVQGWGKKVGITRTRQKSVHGWRWTGRGEACLGAAPPRPGAARETLTLRRAAGVKYPHIQGTRGDGARNGAAQRHSDAQRGRHRGQTGKRTRKQGAMQVAGQTDRPLARGWDNSLYVVCLQRKRPSQCMWPAACNDQRSVASSPRSSQRRTRVQGASGRGHWRVPPVCSKLAAASSPRKSVPQVNPQHRTAPHGSRHVPLCQVGVGARLRPTIALRHNVGAGCRAAPTLDSPVDRWRVAVHFRNGYGARHSSCHSYQPRLQYTHIRRPRTGDLSADSAAVAFGLHAALYPAQARGEARFQ
jgi:hypothetical protein